MVDTCYILSALNLEIFFSNFLSSAPSVVGTRSATIGVMIVGGRSGRLAEPGGEGDATTVGGLEGLSLGAEKDGDSTIIEKGDTDPWRMADDDDDSMACGLDWDSEGRVEGGMRSITVGVEVGVATFGEDLMS